MAERKVLNKHIAPDFNPDIIHRVKAPKDKQNNVRMMLPMTLRCNTCGNYLYIGTKFNMRIETCHDETYLGLKIFRFYFKCSVCFSEVTFKTDPKNHDYTCEHGASRNYEHWRDQKAQEDLLKKQQEDDEEGNTMKYLENRSKKSKREMDILDGLDEIKELNKRNSAISADQLLEFVSRST